MLRNKGTTPVAFVEYLDLMAAVQARSLLHGYVVLLNFAIILIRLTVKVGWNALYNQHFL